MKNNINVLSSNLTPELKEVGAGGKEEMRLEQNARGRAKKAEQEGQSTRFCGRMEPK